MQGNRITALVDSVIVGFYTDDLIIEVNKCQNGKSIDFKLYILWLFSLSNVRKCVTGYRYCVFSL